MSAGRPHFTAQVNAPGLDAGSGATHAWRAPLPDAADGSGTTRAKVLVHRELAPAVSLVRLALEDPAFSWLPGQHAKLSPVPVSGEVTTAVPFSIASAADPAAPGEFELAVSHNAGEALLQALQPGGSVVVSRAKGSFTWKANPNTTLLVGMGTGIAPLRAMLQAALAANVERVLLLYGARTRDKLLFGTELAELAHRRQSQFRFEPTLTQPGNDWQGRRGRVQEHLAPLVEHQNQGRVHVYACGTKTMVDGVIARLGELGIDPKQISSEAHGD